MKHMKAVPQSKSKLAISAGLSALMVVSSLGVASATAFAGEPTGGKPQPNPQPSGQEQPQPKKKHEQPKTVHDWLAQATNAEMTKAVGNFQRHNEKVFKAWHPGVIPEDQFTMQNVPAMDEFKGFSFQKDKTPEPPKPQPENPTTPSVSDALGTLSEEDVNNGIGKMNIKPISELTKDDKTTPEPPKPSPTPSVSDALGQLSEEDVNNGIGKMNIKSIDELTKDDTTPGSSSDTTTPDSNKTPGSDQTPAPDNSGDAANGQAPEGKEEAKAQAEKTPKTGDFFAALLPMLGVALGGTSIAFGKRMRHYFQLRFS